MDALQQTSQLVWLQGHPCPDRILQLFLFLHPAQGMKKKKKKKIKNKIKSQEPAMEQQPEEVSSTFGWYFSGQILLRNLVRSGLLAAGHELCLVMGCLVWRQDQKQVLLPGKVGAIEESGMSL